MLSLTHKIDYPVTYNETDIAEAGGEIAGLWEDIGDVMPLEYIASCRFCGQVQNIGASHIAYGIDESEYVARNCDCFDAKTYANSIMMHERKKSDRIFALENATEIIDEMLEDGAIGFGPVAVKGSARDMLINIAALIYDCELSGASLNVTEWITVKITRSSKGKLTLQRNDKAVSKRELNN